MDNKHTHIDQLIRDKFEQFKPEPPVHIWAGIEQDLSDQKKPVFVFQYARQLAVTAILVFVALLLWYVFPESNQDQLSEIEIVDQAGQSEKESVVFSDEKENQEVKTEVNSAEDKLADENTAETKAASTVKVSTKEVSPGVVAEKHAENAKNQVELTEGRAQQLARLNSKNFSSLHLSGTRASYPGDEGEITVVLNNRKPFSVEPSPAGNSEIPDFKSYWNIGLYFTPEMMLDNFDPVTLMNTYSLNIEPSWYFSKRWFVRFGAGISYVRDRGFAKVDYLSNDYIGSYDSVINITFDTINSELFPVYNTKEVEVWDSIRHLEVSEVTNKYYYLQLPLLFGYHNSTSRFKWYFYGGPAINISVSEQIEDPKAGIEYIKVIQLENSLPRRIAYSMQLWVGAGIDFKIGQRMSLAFEPNYRYYFKPIYKENNYKTALSGLGMRFGLVYKLN